MIDMYRLLHGKVALVTGCDQGIGLCICREFVAQGSIVYVNILNLSFINGGIVPIMLNVHLEKDLKNHLLDTYAPKYICAPADMQDELGGLRAVYSRFDYSLYETDYDRNYLLNDNLALLLTTSGSTGSPKFVRQSYDNIKANTDSIVEYLKLDETEKPIITLPMNYT